MTIFKNESLKWSRHRYKSYDECARWNKNRTVMRFQTWNLHDVTVGTFMQQLTHEMKGHLVQVYMHIPYFHSNMGEGVNKYHIRWICGSNSNDYLLRYMISHFKRKHSIISNTYNICHPEWLFIFKEVWIGNPLGLPLAFIIWIINKGCTPFPLMVWVVYQ